MAVESIATAGAAWRHAARCAGLDPELFHPHEDDPAVEAKAICADCPVRVPCLDHALARRERHGVWGGCTPGERRRMLRRRSA